MLSGEYILCAAIHYKAERPGINYRPLNLEEGYVVCGHRHMNCDALHSMLTGISDDEYCSLTESATYGFLTNTNRFVDRAEGMEIAKKAGQVDQDRRGELYSEHLY